MVDVSVFLDGAEVFAFWRQALTVLAFIVFLLAGGVLVWGRLVAGDWHSCLRCVCVCVCVLFFCAVGFLAAGFVMGDRFDSFVVSGGERIEEQLAEAGGFDNVRFPDAGEFVWVAANGAYSYSADVEVRWGGSSSSAALPVEAVVVDGTLEVCFGAGDEVLPFSPAGGQAALSAGA